MNRALVTGLVGLIFPLAVLSAQAEDNTLTLEMVSDLRQVGAVAVSPAGDAVAYTLSLQRDEEDEPGSSYSELWVVDGEGKEARPFVTGKGRVGAPAWSPDGRRISFLTTREKEHEKAQVYAMPRAGGEARPLTRHDSGVSAYRWSPSGKLLAFVATAIEDEEERKAKEAGKDWKVVDEDARHSELWLLDLETDESRRLIGDLTVRDLEWIDEGSLVLRAAATPRIDDDYMFSKLYRFALGSDKPELIVETEGKLGPLAVSSDGQRLAYLGAVSLNDPLAQSLFVVSTAGGKARNLTSELQGSVAGVAWIDDESLLADVVRGEANQLLRVNAGSGEARQVPWGKAILSGFDLGVSSTGEVLLAAAASTAEHPNELWLADVGGEAVRVTRSNPALNEVRLARQEVTRWRGADGWEIGGVLTYPLDYESGRRYPLVLQIHGGPEGVSLNGWRTRPGYPVQLLAREGYFVLEPNYRGSQGRGVAFSKADHDDLGGKEFEDVLAGIDALVERGLVDGDRVGTGGWSYGGYFSAWAATRYSERFRAAVVCAGLTNWVSFTGTTDIPYEMSLVHWDSWWFDEPELHWLRSPIAHLERAKTPTLIVHGERDDRVHPEQSLELYTGLRIKGVPTRLILYPREPHGLRERAHELHYMQQVLDWFAEHLKAGGGAGGPTGGN